MKYSVLIIQPWLNYRGAETLSYQLAEDLSASGVEARIVSLYVSDYVQNWVKYRFVILPNKLIQRVMKNQFMFLLGGIFSLLYLVMRYGKSFSVLNPHNFPTVWVAVIASRFLKKPVVWTVHNFPQHPFRGLFGWLYELVINPIDRYFVKKVDLVVAVSEKVAKEVYEKYGVTAEIVYPGIDVDFWKNDKEPFRLESKIKDKRVMLHAAQIRPEKEQVFTYKVFCELAEIFDDLVLVFAGEIYEQFLDYQDNLRTNLKFRERVFFTGNLSKSQLGTLYKESTIVIHPSSWGEGCALVPLEAIAAGASNVVVARGCGSDEILERENGGIVFDIEKGVKLLVKDLTEILEGHLSDHDQQFILRYDRKLFSKNYDRLFSRLLE
jgi:glycosyltransferase involved in cell wall biosynthesis